MSSFTSSSKRREKLKSTASSTTTTNPKRKRYNVYLSFCDEDATYFATEIYWALSIKARFNVFWDDEKLGSGNREIPTSVLNVIGDCKVAVIVFSRNYVNSRSCIQEFEKITECCLTTGGLIVLPVLYDGLNNYSAIGTSGEAFHDFVHRIWIKENESSSEEEDKFMSWVAAITKATTYSGLIDFADSYGREYIKDVVESVTRAVKKKRDLLGVFYTVSVKSSVQDVIQLLKQSRSPLLLGIWGMAGIGKSTIAEAIYNRIGPYFEHKYLLDNVREFWKRDGGPVSLQKKLLSYRGIPTEMQIGSKIIITTRDRHLLKEHGVDHIYTVKELEERESIELFNQCAFSQATTPQEGFGELSRQLVTYSRGLPFALKALGGFLHGKEVLEWKSVWSSLERFSFPDQEVLQALETSFDDLSDEEKQIFLDIACFFNGMDKNDVLHTLNRSTQCTDLQISLLEDKSLLAIDENNKLQMHVLLQAMAKYIIKMESSNKTDQPKMYDVFLSFRGEDSRVKFMSHLYSSLQNAGIHAFRDDNEIQRGDQISISLLRAIGQSRISIIILSTNYANSRWCMLELVKIMEIGRTRGMVVMPVFYDVNPSEVRHQDGQFGKAFKDLISKISVDESTKSHWRRDLIDIGGTAGFVLVDS
ncbi:NBS-LRR resistance protein, partial [Trifolium pratense]